MSNPPRSPADPRPGGKPYYIDPNCPVHHTPLVPLELAFGWHDEWHCPQCPDVWMDWPTEEWEMLQRAEDEPGRVRWALFQGEDPT